MILLGLGSNLNSALGNRFDNINISNKATKVDGVYNRDPKRFSDAVRYDNLTYLEVLRQEIAVMDSTAIALCKDNNIPIVVFNLFEPAILLLPDKLR